MKLFLKLALVVCIPFLIMVIVNEFYNEPTSKQFYEKCTRSYHNKGCEHFAIKLKDKTNTSWAVKNFALYRKNIEWLKNNPLGLGYYQMNILVYVIVFPIICVILLIRLLK